jgi:hypothetical protein
MAKAAPTRTLNPLPFQDLEPHRFEDLVRQLAYDLRPWKSLEATGRGGSDEGIDIRGIESVRALIEDEPEGDGEAETEAVVEERLWVFQCKREKSLTPKRLQEVVHESLVSFAKSPYGFVLAVSCDVSKKARDTFREEMVARGVEEFALWAKGELEDMLFQPKNDRLLFAYFGLSLQTRRRSLSTTLRSQIAKKKQLAALLDEESDSGTLVLLRDPTDERYPKKPKKGDAPPRWLPCRAITRKNPGCLIVLRHEYLAAMTPNHTQWDAYEDDNVAEALAESDLRSMNAWGIDELEPSQSDAMSFWWEYIPEQDRAYLKVYRAVHLDRILAIDMLGDGFFPIPHILVDFDNVNGPFTPEAILHLENPSGERLDPDPRPSNRAQIFPKPLPGELDLPPNGFDDTIDVKTPLSAEAEEKLSTLLTAIAVQRDSGKTADEHQEGTREHSHNDKLPFLEWRDTVAQPLFSAFVSRLRAEGHSARVVLRSVEPMSNRHEAIESIELRVKLHVGSTYNPTYRASGHIQISMSESRGWWGIVSPAPGESRGRYSQAPFPHAEAMTQEQLEALVLATLERLRAQG